MRIIKKGRMPRYRHTCNYCKTKFSFTLKDCPDCGRSACKITTLYPNCPVCKERTIYTVEEK